MSLSIQHLSSTQAKLVLNGVDIATFTSDGARMSMMGTMYSQTQALTDSTTIPWNTHNGQNAEVSITTNRTMGTPTGLVNGGIYTLGIYQPIGGNCLVTFPGVFKFINGVAPVLSTTGLSKDFWMFRSDGTNLYELASSVKPIQTWQNVTGSRSIGNTYTNTTSLPITLAIQCSTGGPGGMIISCAVNGGTPIPFGAGYSAGGSYPGTGTIIIPAGATYNISLNLGGLSSWWELK